ncbi:MAG TPA: hypothetical protein PKI10_15935, partial [Syntrophorhabdus sp.]|nr:hypothetical protein [Syntrophorhabdus sp.]
MTDIRNHIESIIDNETAHTDGVSDGVVSKMLKSYDIYDRSSLLGFLLKMDYDELTLVTCDAW